MLNRASCEKPRLRRTRDPEGTRERILAHAFDEIYEKGYAGASLDEILADSGVTKGALYHHFGSKGDLVVAVIDEVVRPRVLDRWVTPLRGAEDPIAALVELCECNFADADERLIECGCPLNNLSQELSNAGERFRTHLEGAYEAWRGGVAEAFARGQASGSFRQDVDPDAAASFVVASIEGLATTLKTSRDFSVARAAAEVFLQFLHSLRPAADRTAA